MVNLIYEFAGLDCFVRGNFCNTRSVEACHVVPVYTDVRQRIFIGDRVGLCADESRAIEAETSGNGYENEKSEYVR